MTYGKIVHSAVRSLAFDFGTAAIVGVLGGWPWFFGFLLVLYGSSIGLAIYRSFRLVCNYYIFGGKNALTRTHLDILQARNFPKKRKLYEDGSEYLTRICRDKSVPVGTRLSCAEVVGCFDALRVHKPLEAYLMILAFDDAVATYADVEGSEETDTFVKTGGKEQ